MTPGRRRHGRCLPLAFVLACSGTDSNPPPSPAVIEPAGWVYFASGVSQESPVNRVDVRTGVIRLVEFPPPLPPDRTFFFKQGMVSPLSGDIASADFSGFFWPTTYVLDAASGVVTSHADPTRVTQDFGHYFAPDGKRVVFTRRSVDVLGSATRLVVLDTKTGEQDTVLTAPSRVTLDLPVWIGTDSLLVNWYSQSDNFQFRVLAIGDSDAEVFTEFVHPGLLNVPAFSADSKWAVHWIIADSATGEPIGDGVDGQVPVTVQLLRNRQTGVAAVLAQHPFDATPSLSAVFSPDSRFLARCASEVEMVLVRVADGSEVKRLAVPGCRGLSWSWGPDGPPLGR